MRVDRGTTRSAGGHVEGSEAMNAGEVYAVPSEGGIA